MTAPKRPWRWRQQWHDLLFAHWRVPTSSVRALVPAELHIQEFDGSSWIGVVPFRMEGVMLRGLPDFPGISAFAELNLRLYVEAGGKPGVWFLSLDAANRLAVFAARALFDLPYFHARMTVDADGDGVRYRSERVGGGPRFRGAYRPAGPLFESKPGTIEHFLTERYCLFAQRKDGTIVRADVHHRPWPLQPAEAEIVESTFGAEQGIELTGSPLLHFAKRLDVVVWSPVPVKES